MMSNLKAIQNYLQTHNIDALIVPHDDMFAGEYLAPHDERLAWATGFTGSAGMAIITAHKALLHTDSRYSLQAPQQAKDCDVTESNAQPFTQILDWLNNALPQGGTLALDPWLFNQKRLEHWQNELKNTSFSLNLLQQNPIDILWHNKPKANNHQFWWHDIAYAGLSSTEKLAQLNITIPTILTDIASVNWLLNIRGNDVPYTPILQAFALITPQGDITLFVDLAKTPATLPSHIKCVDLNQLTNFDYPKTLVADPATCPAALWEHWQTHNIAVQARADSLHMLRTLKNPTELVGAAQAHIYDGVAITQFLYWFSQQQERTDLTEIEIVQQLQGFRKTQPHYFSDSFATIAGSGPNGAIVHYKPEAETCRTLQPNEILLLDSGGQYPMGTTDITRTLWFGPNPPTAQAQHIYTHVLKSHIAAAMAIFPAHKTTGVQIDALARAPLWAQGLDFGHGLGHGVGSFASVHDGAVGLSPRSQGVLAESMLLTIEPGVYLENIFGVRLENVYAVKQAAFDNMLYFNTLTLAPFEQQLIDSTQLNAAEKTWLNHYHQQVFNTLVPLLDEHCTAWLKNATASLA